ncbi:MAG: hypothetical protein R3B98_09030 [Hyphomonas sp.]
MRDLRAFLHEAFEAVRAAVLDFGVRAGFERLTPRITKAARRRCLSGMRQLAILIRRLIFLMALSIELAPADPREGWNFFNSDDPKAKRAWRGLSLVPPVSRPFPDHLRTLSGPAIAGKVSAIPVVTRWVRLLEALSHREQRARQLARILRRWRAAGEAKPHVRPMARVHRLPPKLGLIAGALTVQLTTALQGWPDTG